MRLVNPDGLPVRVEQEILLLAPRSYEQLVPVQCWQISEIDDQEILIREEDPPAVD